MNSDFGLIQHLSNPSEIVKERGQFASNTRLRDVVATSARRYILYVTTLLVPFYLDALSYASEFERMFDFSTPSVTSTIRYRMAGTVWESTITDPLSSESVLDQLLLLSGQTFNIDPMTGAYVLRSLPKVVSNVILLPILAVVIYHIFLYITGVSPNIRDSVIAIEHSAGIYLVSAYSLYTFVIPELNPVRSPHPESEFMKGVISYIINGPAILMGAVEQPSFTYGSSLPILSTLFIVLLLYSVYSLYLHSRLNQNAGRIQSVLSIVLLLATFMTIQMPLLK